MSTTITRHPDSANLMSYAAGSLAEPLAAAISAHVAMCAACARELRLLQSLGGALLDDLPAEGMPKVPAVPALLGRPSPRLAQAAIADGRLPHPLGERYGIDLDQINWRWLGPGVWFHKFELSPGVVGDLRLMKIAAGRRMPQHGHGGTELTLVLAGAFSDVTGTYRQGDIQDVDDDIEHRPIVGPDAVCICLVATERPARFKGVIGRMLQPWSGM